MTAGLGLLQRPVTRPAEAAGRSCPQLQPIAALFVDYVLTVYPEISGIADPWQENND